MLQEVVRVVLGRRQDNVASGRRQMKSGPNQVVGPLGEHAEPRGAEEKDEIYTEKSVRVLS